MLVTPGARFGSVASARKRIYVGSASVRIRRRVGVVDCMRTLVDCKWNPSLEDVERNPFRPEAHLLHQSRLVHGG
jgi:hypothetical protein